MTKESTRTAWVAAAMLLALLLWDLSGLDLVVARWFGSSSGFPLRDHWFLVHVMHDGMKQFVWVFTAVLFAIVIWPPGAFAAVPLRRRLQLPVTALLAAAVIGILKGSSATSCPWDMTDFGGKVQLMSHWMGWFVRDGGDGRCFPAGHAATGFVFVGGYFALRRELAGLARAWLAAALVVGFALGIGQQIRGAHFMSHTLWTGYLCWLVGWLADPLFAKGASRRIGVDASAVPVVVPTQNSSR